MSLEAPKTGFAEKIYAIIAIVIGAAILLSIFGQLVKVGKDIPPENIVYVDATSHIYYAPPYILGKKYPSDLDISNLKGKPVAEAKKENYKPDGKCVEMGYFEEKVTLTEYVLIKLGLIHPAPSRWNPDGTWNW